MLKGAAGKLVGIGSDLPSASAFARIYIWLLVAACVSIKAATTAQLRISVVMGLIKISQLLSPALEALREWDNRTATEQLAKIESAKQEINQAPEKSKQTTAREVNYQIVKVQDSKVHYYCLCVVQNQTHAAGRKKLAMAWEAPSALRLRRESWRVLP